MQIHLIGIRDSPDQCSLRDKEVKFIQKLIRGSVNQVELLPCSTARLGVLHGSSTTWFQTTAVLKSNLIRSIEFGTAVAQRLKRASSRIKPSKLTSLTWFILKPSISILRVSSSLPVCLFLKIM